MLTQKAAVGKRSPFRSRCAVPVTINTARGGNGAVGGGVSVASFMAGSTTAENATAAAALIWSGGDGGTVRFRRAWVVQWGTVAAGNGGTGGTVAAQAGGGDDEGIFFAAEVGGDARAIGGTGGKPGARPQFVMPGGVPAQGTPGQPGSGGRATAVGGAGGKGTGPFPNGNSSGTARAWGGRNGSGVAPGPPRPVVAGPNPAVGAAGSCRRSRRGRLRPGRSPG